MAKKELKTYKCNYNHCKLDGIVSEDIAVKSGNRYYHKECLKEAENKNNIRKLFLDNINPTEVVSLLNRVINIIIEDKKTPSDFLLYALQYVIKNKLTLNHANGLYYIINNTKIKDSYQKDKVKELAKQIKVDTTEIVKSEVSFNLDSNKDNWNKILQR